MDKTPEVEEKQRKIRGQNLVPFLAHLEKVRPEIEAGWPIRAVYNRYAETLDMSYIQFTRYVNRYIRQAKPSTQLDSKAADPSGFTQAIPPEKPAVQQETENKAKPVGFKGFIPGPKNPDPKELW